MGRAWIFVWPYLRELLIFATAITCAFILACLLAVASMLIHEDVTAREALGSNVQFILGMATMWWIRRP